MKRSELIQITEYKSYLRLNLQLFAEEGAGGEKTEEATAKRLDDARKEGQVNKSQELVTAAMLFALFISIKIFVGYMADNFIKAFPENYTTIHVYATEMPNIGFFTALLRQGYIRILITTLPMFAIAIIVAFGVNVAQVKWKPTAKPLQPKLDKISPLKGFKRMFSADKIFELVKSVVKIALVFYIAWTTIVKDYDTIKIFYELELLQAVKYIGNFVINMGVKISAIYLLIGFADFIYHYFKFKKDMRMTKQEVKDEFKQTEGDPQIKGRIKQKMREASQRRMMEKVPGADVVITNPTHFACALKYDKAVSSAPVLVAKGADFVAQKIKEVARENKVPIVENKALARMLYTNVDLDSEIPPELYAMAAEVLSYVYQTTGKQY